MTDDDRVDLKQIEQAISFLHRHADTDAACAEYREVLRDLARGLTRLAAEKARRKPVPSPS